MAKNHIELFYRMYVGGYDLSGDSRTFGSGMNDFESIDMHGWNETVKNYVAGRRGTGLTGYQALLNDAAAKAYQILKNTPNAYPVSLLFGGGAAPVAGDPAYIIGGIQMGDPASFQNNAAVITSDFMPASNQTPNNSPWARVLLPDTSLSATGNGTSVNNEVATADGGVANLHILATAAGDYEFKIEHSPDNAAWATLLTFVSDGSAIGSESLAIAKGTTVDKYTRLVRTRTAGTCEAVCSLARN